MPCFAHSLEGFPPDKWQPLEEHLASVAEKAAGFAAGFSSREWGLVAGRLHDLGKVHPDFQAYLFRENGLDSSEFDGEATGGRINHSGCGAVFALDNCQPSRSIIGRTIAYLIAGHHAGLPDWHGGRDSLSQRLEAEKPVFEGIRDKVSEFAGVLPLDLRPPDFAGQCRNGEPMAFHLWVRMVFSCLVDADFLDTEAFMDSKKASSRLVFPTLAELKPRFDLALEAMMVQARARSPEKNINRIRAGILADCRKAALEEPGMFTLTVPTGGGKTLSGTAFALDHAVRHGKKRIVYVIPYTSIIEQTADVLRGFLGATNVVEHHSNIAPERERETPGLSLATENWDAPVIVTTNVQFFESLYAAKPGRCRKLHNLVNSVVILDEAQLLPPKWLFPCTEALNRLVSDYRVTVVLSTATQPALDRYLERPPREIIPNPSSLFGELQRTSIRFPENLDRPTDWPTLAAELQKHQQVLCIVNRRRDCFDLWKAMPEDTIHLSALMCGQHRSNVIATIKARLETGDAVRVISTQLVEAGVDMDFPVVYRALAGLASINQAAGRCNREGRLDRPGMVHVFIPPEGKLPDLLRKGRDTTRELCAAPEFAPADPEIFRSYFQLFYSSVNDLGETWLRDNLVKNVNHEGHVQFRTAGGEFRLIDEYSVPIVVSYGNNEKLIERLRFGGPTREIMRALQRFTVTVPGPTADHLLTQSFIEKLHDRILVQVDTTLYRENLGLDLHREAYSPEDLCI